MENIEHMENGRTWNTSYIVGLHLRLTLENSGEHRAHGEQENIEY